MSYGLNATTFEAEAGVTYYLVIDGYIGAEGSFDIAITCEGESGPAVEACDNDEDDDGDGQIDCLDSDCFGVSDLCQPSCDINAGGFPMACGDTDAWDNTGFGSTNAIDGYPGCFDVGMHTGPEYAYVHTAEADTQVTVIKTGDLDSELDMFVLVEGGQGCNPASCIEWGTDSVTFTTTAGTDYYLIVDGWIGGESEYELAFSCGE